MPGETDDDRLRAILRGSEMFAVILRTVRELGLPQWVVGGGAVRDVVWGALSRTDGPVQFADVDVAFFDPARLDPDVERWAEEELGRRLPGHHWDVKNQAAVHLWYEQRFGLAVDPLPSIEAAVATWPETATAVAVRLEADDGLTIVAPVGLDDLLGMVWRHNPTRVGRETYAQRLAVKRPEHRWPGVRIVREG